VRRDQNLMDNIRHSRRQYCNLLMYCTRLKELIPCQRDGKRPSRSIWNMENLCLKDSEHNSMLEYLLKMVLVYLVK
jgi:hypothetical protein